MWAAKESFIVGGKGVFGAQMAIEREAMELQPVRSYYLADWTGLSLNVLNKRSHYTRACSMI